MFAVDAITGRLVTAHELDSNTKRYMVVVRATDQLNQTAVCQVGVYNVQG